MISIALAHSYLGEKYILIRLFRRPLPKLFGSDQFTRQTLRYAWHVTSVTWMAIAGVFLLVASDAATPHNILYVFGSMAGAIAIIALVASKGKHLSWIVFGLIAALCFGYTVLM